MGVRHVGGRGARHRTAGDWVCMRDTNLRTPAAPMAPAVDALSAGGDSRTTWLDVLAAVSRRLTIAGSVEELSRIAVDQLASVFDLISVSFYEPLHDGDAIRLVASAGTARELVEAAPIWSTCHGVIGRAVRTGETVLAADLSADPDYVALIDATRSELVVPVRAGAAVVGIIDLQSRHPDQFSSTAVEVVEAIAAQAAVVRDIATLRLRQERRLREQEAVHRAALAVLDARGYEETLVDIVTRVGELCGASEAGIYVVEPDRLHLRMVQTTGAAAGMTGAVISMGQGVAGVVAATGEPHAVSDYARWQGRARTYDGLPWRAVAGVPMWHNGEVIGVLDVMSTDPEVEFDDEDIRLLELFAAPAALALANASRSEEHIADLVTAASVSRHLSEVIDPVEARREVCRIAVELLGCNAVLLWERDARGGLVNTAVVGAELATGMRQPPDGSSPSLEALRTELPVFCPSQRGRRPPDLVAATGCTAVYAQPVVRGRSVAGTLVAGWGFRSTELSDREASLMALLAQDAAVALERVDLVARLDQLARRDSLTGMANRRAWEEELPRMLAAAQRSHHSLSVAMLDLDHFKMFNDIQGHQRGDLLLREVTMAWQANLRDGDVLARYGGEEFCVALPGCGVDAAGEIIERLRGTTPAGQTCSAGIATWDGAEDADGLVARADAALYEAKRSGRDRTVTALATGAAARAGSGRAGWTRWTGMVPGLLADGRVVAHFQPVVDLRLWLDAGSPRRPGPGMVAGYEALARVAGRTVDREVDGLFAAAQYRGLARDLDWAARRAAARGAIGMPDGALLFVNVGVSSLLDPFDDVEHLILLLQRWGRTPDSTVLEITEREAVRDLERFTQAVGAYRERGFRFAVDDVGEGHSTFEVLAATTPEFVKVARSLVSSVERRGARAAVRGVVAFAEEAESVVIAEAIERPELASVMLELGVALGQGWALGMPAVRPPGFATTAS